MSTPYTHACGPCVPQDRAWRPKDTARGKDRGRRHYAVVTDDGGPLNFDHYVWPRSLTSSSVPSPYEIFQMKKNARYTKIRYYQLVKIYHPDRSVSHSKPEDLATIPRHTRTERYRLIVAAHEILSDPVKRQAYDRTGAGWNGAPESDHCTYSTRQWRGASWSGFHANDSPYPNATWEDWEKWYERQNGKRPPQAPIYTSNISFVMFILSAVSIGAISQRMTIESRDFFYKEQAAQAHERASEYYRTKVADSDGHSNNDLRIHSFLARRERTGFGSFGSLPESERAEAPQARIEGPSHENG